MNNKAVFLAILDEDGKYILLIRRNDNSSGFPGGYIENNENKITALKREVMEEINFDMEYFTHLTEEIKTSSNRIFLYTLFISIDKIRFDIIKNFVYAKHFGSEILGIELLKINVENIKNIFKQTTHGNFKEQLLSVIEKYKLLGKKELLELKKIS